MESQNQAHVHIKDQRLYPNQSQDAKLQSETSSVLQSPESGLKGHACSLSLQNQDKEPKFVSWMYQRPMSICKSRSRCPTQVRNLQCQPEPKKTMDVLCTFKIKIVKIWIIVVSKIFHHIQINIKMLNPSLEPPAYSNSPNQDS